MIASASCLVSATPVQNSKPTKDPRSLEKHALEAIMMMKKKEPVATIPVLQASGPLQQAPSKNEILKSDALHKPSFNSLIVAANAKASRKNMRAALGLKAGPWTKHEDDLLRKAVENVNKSESRPQYFWTKVAESVPLRDNEQCRNRWRYHVNPDLCRDRFSPKEFRFFLEFQRDKGNCWTELGRQLNGRSRTFVANEWQHARRNITCFLATKRGVPESYVISKDGKIDYQEDFEACLEYLVSRRCGETRKKPEPPALIMIKPLVKSGNVTSDTESVSDSDSSSLSSSEAQKRDGKDVNTSSTPAWTVQEDHVLMTMASQMAHKHGKWAIIADRFSRRNAKDCRDRWEAQKGKLNPQSIGKPPAGVPLVLHVDKKARPAHQVARSHSWGHTHHFGIPHHPPKRTRHDEAGRWKTPSHLHGNHFYQGSSQVHFHGVTQPDLSRAYPSTSAPYAGRAAQVPLPTLPHAGKSTSTATQPKVAAPHPESMDSPKKEGRTWTHSEDEVLRQTMAKHSGFSTECVEELTRVIPSRNIKQCKQRWACQIQPGLNRDPLTPEQIRELLVLQRTWGNRWTSIGKALGGQKGGYSKSFVSNRWFHRIRPALFNYLSNKHKCPYSEVQTPNGVINYGDDFEEAVDAVIQEVLFNGRRYQNPGRL